jgi:hypothetical protein
MIAWISQISILLLGLLLFGAMLLAAWAGARFHNWHSARHEGARTLTDSQEGYILTSIYTLVGLMIAFTFGMAIERFETRRQLVTQDANAIETLYLSAQLIPEPHKTRFSQLLLRYADNHIRLAKLRRDDANARSTLAEDDMLIDALSVATVPAFESIRTIDFSSSFVEGVKEVVRTDAMRRAARRAEIPPAVIGLLMLYTLIAAAALGYVMVGRQGELIGGSLLGLFVLAFMLLSDINRPVGGWIRESQEPMERMLARLKAYPPAATVATVNIEGSAARPSKPSHRSMPTG